MRDCANRRLAHGSLSTAAMASKAIPESAAMSAEIGSAASSSGLLARDRCESVMIVAP